MSNAQASKIIFIDPTVKDYDRLIENISVGDTQYFVLDSAQDGILQITEILQAYSGVESIHIVSHGGAGTVQLGSSFLNASTLDRYTSQLQSWSNSLTENADILFYGCDIAAGDQGGFLIQQISEFTGADIAASVDRTGSTALGGDWDLEAHAGAVESSLAFSQQAMQSYQGVLPGLFNEAFTGNDVVNPNWIYGHAGTSADPFLTARTGTAASPGGIPGRTTAIDTPGNGALRLTSAVANQAAFVINTSAVSTAAGLSITFNFSSYGGTGADGIVFFLIDDTANPTQAGGFGGSLGYAQNTSTSQPGLVGGYLGIGYDEFGNFSNPTEGRVGGPGARADSIAVRGSQSNSYKYLTGTAANLPGGIDNPAGNRTTANRKTRIDITPTGLLSVKIDLNNDGDFLDASEAAITNFNITAVNGALPANLQFGFSAGTGGSTNIHEVRNLDIQPFTEPPATTDASATAAPGGTVKLSGMSATDPDGTIASYFVTILPDAADGALYLGDPGAGGTLITVGQSLTAAQLNQLYFKANSTFDGGSFKYNARDNLGATDPTPGTVTLIVDSTAPVVTVNFLTTNDGTPQLTGTVNDPTAVIKVTVNGTTYTAANNGNGTWTLPDNSIAPTLADGTYNVTATATDPSGNIGTEATTQELRVDTTAPTIAISLVAGDDIVNAAEAANPVAISGTTTGVEDGRTVTVTLDGKTYTATVTSNAWTLNVPVADIINFESTELITADVSDLVGNSATQATRTITYDSTIPAIAINPVATNDIINALEAGSPVTISGTTLGIGDGRIVTVTLDGKTYTATVTNNAWTLNVPVADIANFESTELITADVSDLAGNAATQAGRTIAYDPSVPTIAINSIATDDIINALEAGSPVAISGTTTGVEDGRTVTVNVDGKTYTTTVTGNAWTLNVLVADITSFEATELITADVSDLAGNPATQATRTITYDPTAPTIAINPVATDDIINAVEDDSPVAISGTTTGVEDGRTVTVNVDGKTYTTTVTSNAWTLNVSVADVAAFESSELVTADVSDLAGNAAVQATSTIAYDPSAPTIAISPVAIDDIINAIEDNAPVAISGTTTGVEDGRIITVNIDGTTYTSTVTGNAWTLSIPIADVAAFETTELITADVSDLAGNPAVQATRTITYDPAAPTIAINPVAIDDIINAIEDNAPVAISGTTTGVEDGRIVTVTVDGITYTTTVTANAWTLSVPVADVTNTNLKNKQCKSRGCRGRAPCVGAQPPLPHLQPYPFKLV